MINLKCFFFGHIKYFFHKETEMGAMAEWTCLSCGKIKGRPIQYKANETPISGTYYIPRQTNNPPASN